MRGGPQGWSMDRVHEGVHGPGPQEWSMDLGSMFCIRPFLGSYALCIKTLSQRQILSVCHFEDENTRDSLACRLGTSNCESLFFKCRPFCF